MHLSKSIHSKLSRQLILADAHVHIYNCFALEQLIDSVLTKFIQRKKLLTWWQADMQLDVPVNIEKYVNTLALAGHVPIFLVNRQNKT